ncbi:MAG: CRTAC1 family protein [Thermoanaerobaculia bacterium]|nr:CRTAC1 family protein [Thermoanaerobaculia bacterium]
MMLPVVLALALLAQAPASPIRFADAAARWGLEFQHHRRPSGEFPMPEIMGSGLAVLDYDGDGDEDVFFVDSGGPSRLFRNEGGGRFVDVTVGSGIVLPARSYAMGVTAGDYDGDGDPDLYVTAYGPSRLFVNQGDGTFRDGTAVAGLEIDSWTVSAAFADADLDGDLDLYVGHYVDFSPDNNPPCGLADKGLRSYCHPEVYRGLPDRYFENRGDGTFVDATVAAGFGVAKGKALGVLFSDFDLDGDPDLYVANDMEANFLFENQGPGPILGKFTEVAMLAGAALSERGQPEASMGLEAGDLDGDGRFEIMTTHLDFQTNAVYRSRSGLIFADARHAFKLGEPSFKFVGFGLAFADFDHDGLTDITIANGHIVHNIDAYGIGSTFRQRNQVFRGTATNRFEELTATGLDAVRPSRGLAVGDLDGDGDLDLVITNNDELAEVYENLSPGAGSFLAVELEGPGHNRHAIGARLELTAPGLRRQVREVRTASSYASQNARAAHFGLAGADKAELVVKWPGGGTWTVRGVAGGWRVRGVAP